MTDPLTYLDEVDARVAAATEGPWVEANGTVMHSTFYGLAPVTGNAEFIAHAREDVPTLLAEVRRLRALVAKPDPGGCDVCGSPDFILTTPGAIRLCDAHGGKR